MNPERMKNSKEAIVSVAIKVFGRLGLYKTTMSDIAKAANKGRRTIYQYFSTKEEIYDAVIEKETDNLICGLNEAIEGESDPSLRLKNYLFERMKTIYNLSVNYQAFRSGIITKDRVVDKLRIKFDKNDITMIKEMLTEGVEKGLFFVSNVELTTHTMIATLKGLEISFIRRKFNDKCKEQLNDYINLLFNGISTTKRISIN